jgi:dienelactone hydrolase
MANHLEAVKYLNEKLGWQLEVEVVATADWFDRKAKGAGKRFGVPEGQCFGGGDAYRKALDVGPDIVVMAQLAFPRDRGRPERGQAASSKSAGLR